MSGEGTEQSDDEASPRTIDPDQPLLDHHAFIFGYRSSDVDLRPLHPLPSQIPYIWQVYLENVDNAVKIVHIPTMQKLVRTTQSNLNTLTPATETLMFAIYYAAVTSLDEDEVCHAIFELRPCCEC